MRVPQRSFVVEFKSRSRQTKASKPTSIWGDTDLKAVARQVEEQSAHLFDQPTGQQEVNAAAPQLEASLPVPAPLERPVSPGESETPLAKTQTAAAVLMDLPLAKDVENGPSETVGRPPAVSETPAPQSMNLRKTKPRAVRSKREAAPGTAPGAALDVREAFASAAELTALEAENRRLKALLREHLSAENAHLAAMLLRFL